VSRTLYMLYLNISKHSVADLVSLSRILIFIHPGSNNSNKRGGGKFVVLPIFCSHKYHKIDNYFILSWLRTNFVQGAAWLSEGCSMA
jgi:hypothetical protein